MKFIDFGNQLLRVTKKLIKLFYVLLQALLYTISFLISPLGIFLIIVLFVFVNIFSFLKVFGPSSIESFCDTNGVPNIDKVEEDKRDSAIYGYFISSNSMIKEVAAYLSLIAEKQDFNFDRFEYDSGCNYTCFKKKFIEDIKDINDIEQYKKEVLPEYLNKIKIGPYNLTGEQIYQILFDEFQGKIVLKSSWNKSYIQLAVVKNLVEERSNITDSPFLDETRLEDAIREVNDLFHITQTGTNIQNAIYQVNDLIDKNKDLVIGCVSMGTGKGRGRVDGGGAIDTGGFGFLDLTDLINFLESYHTSIKIKTTNEDGSKYASPEMIEAKTLAQNNGGEDPMPSLYSSCDRDVAIGLKAMEIDINFPWGAVIHQHEYMKESSDWVKIDDPCQRESGDVIVWPTSHIGFYGINSEGKEMIYQASYQDYLPYKSFAPWCSTEIYGKPVEYWRFIGKRNTEIKESLEKEEFNTEDDKTDSGQITEDLKSEKW